MTNATADLTAKDFTSDQEVRWCPGCGDYAILKAVQRMLPGLGVAKEKFVFVSGIGCSSRFPYFVNTQEEVSLDSSSSDFGKTGR